MTLGALVVAAVLIVGGFFLGYSLVRIPAANALATKQSNVYLYADGTVLAREGKVNRESVALAKISEDAQHAVLAAEAARRVRRAPPRRPRRSPPTRRRRSRWAASGPRTTAASCWRRSRPR
ncbi:hypothetical protein SFUMM280S_06486 [Streptomyces fumanus]